jgi:hypothetical protein
MTDSSNIRPLTVRGKAISDLHACDKISLINNPNDDLNIVNSNKIDTNDSDHSSGLSKRKRVVGVYSPVDNRYSTKYVSIATPNDIHKTRFRNRDFDDVHSPLLKLVDLGKDCNIYSDDEDAESYKCHSDGLAKGNNKPSKYHNKGKENDVNNAKEKKPSQGLSHLNSKMKDISQLLHVQSGVPISAITLDLS